MKMRVKRFFLVIILAAFAHPIAAQTLKEKLSRQTNFIPQNAPPLDQLIEVGRKFQIPMSIEWLDEKDDVTLPPLSFRGGSVNQLIEAIVGRSPKHQMSVDVRVVHVSSSFAYSHPLNFLNMRIRRFSVEHESLLGAQAALRHSINELLYPDFYKNGWGGGYGGGWPSEFWERGITFSGDDLTIRQILDGIIEGAGRFLWVVRLNREELSGEKSKWEGVPIDKYGQSPLNTRWQFVLLREEPSNIGMNRTRYQRAS